MNFFSQNDPRWSKDKIGDSKWTLGQKGCTIDCVADASSYFGEETTPKEIARMPMFTPDGLILWTRLKYNFKTFEFEYRGYNYDKNKINEALKNPDKVVMVNVDKKAHWVFITGSYIPVFGYKVNDPFPFPSKSTRRNDIVGYAILRRK